jgi:hypothetical protein
MQGLSTWLSMPSKPLYARFEGTAAPSLASNDQSLSVQYHCAVPFKGHTRQGSCKSVDSTKAQYFRMEQCPCQDTAQLSIVCKQKRAFTADGHFAACNAISQTAVDACAILQSSPD